MINPTAELYTAGIACLLPVLVMLMGSLLLGTAIGHWFGPEPKDISAPLHAEIQALGEKLDEAEAKLAVSTSIMMQRSALRDEDAAAARMVVQEEIAALNAQNSSLKMALAAARRPAPPDPRPQDPVMADPKLLARIADLESAARRVPALLKEVHDLRGLFTSETASGTPDYAAVSRAFGKRIVPDDLKLVEGIGPKIAEHLGKHGLRSWSEVAKAKPEEIRKVLAEAGDRFLLHDPSSWPKQCRLMVEQRWEELRKYQRQMQRAR
ncbi:MAG: hypothetical protein IPL52_02180 [Flavobacteriales bacterium]|nr:hypothetical protein [Flavobacteriales bacterium]